MSDDDSESPIADEPGWTDIGHDHAIRFATWDPDLTLNPHYECYADILPIDPAGVTVRHGDCLSGATFDTMPAAVRHDNQTWHLVSKDPLTIEPSLLCTRCGDHGFIRDGRWIPA